MRQGPSFKGVGLKQDLTGRRAEKATPAKGGPEGAGSSEKLEDESREVRQLKEQFRKLEDEYRGKGVQMHELVQVHLREARESARTKVEPGQTSLDDETHNAIVDNVQSGEDWKRLDQEKGEAYKRLHETATELVKRGVKVQHGSRGYPRIVE